MSPVTVTNFAEAEKNLANTLPGYESRPQQQALAVGIENLLAATEIRSGLFEAGCGTGKSLGALIPAILSGKRVIVATATKALQNQYAEKDVPFLEENLGVEFTWALLKGRSNYWCRANALKADHDAEPWIGPIEAMLNEDRDHSGDVEDLPIPDKKGHLVTISGADCAGRDCPFFNDCFANNAKAKAANSQVVITNTAMLMTDLVIREQSDGYAALLGNYDAVIIDEAHEVEEWATSALSGGVSPKGISRLILEVDRFAKDQETDLTDITGMLDRATDASWDLINKAGATARTPQSLPRRWFLDNSESWVQIVESAKALAFAVEEIVIKHGDRRKVEARQSLLVKRARNIAVRIESVLFDEDSQTVRWAEVEENARYGNTTHLKVAPVHVGPFLNRNLWSQVPVALISATLSVAGNFSYVSERLGLKDPITLNVGTPFDYTTQARLFLPVAAAPNPKDQIGHRAYVSATTMDLITASGGGALLLFTSKSAMTTAYNNLSEQLESRGFTTFMQGNGSNKEIAAAFKADTHSVLFAMKTFMTGFDAAGDTCRLVIIDKLPFAVPTDPIFAARSAQVDARGGRSFGDLAIPAMTLTMIQAFGRLIRSKSDTGVVAILDSRLTSTPWGKKIAQGMPKAPVIHSTAQAAEFFAS